MTKTNRLPTYHPDEFKAFNAALEDLLDRLLRYTEVELADKKIKRFITSSELRGVRVLEAQAKKRLAFYKASCVENGAAARDTQPDIILPNQTVAQICDILLAALKEAECVAEIYAPVVLPDELVTEKFQGLAERVDAPHLEQLIALRRRLNPRPVISDLPPVIAAMQ